MREIENKSNLKLLNLKFMMRKKYLEEKNDWKLWRINFTAEIFTYFRKVFKQIIFHKIFALRNIKCFQLIFKIASSSFPHELFPSQTFVAYKKILLKGRKFNKPKNSFDFIFNSPKCDSRRSKEVLEESFAS